jgi:hypothetical protein
MRKMVIVLIAAGLAATPAAAAGRFSLAGGYALGTRAMIGGGPAAELSLEIPLSRSLSFEIVSGYAQVAAKDDPTGLRAGTVRIVPLEAGLRFRAGLGRTLSLFAAAGAGLGLPFSSLDPDLAAGWEAVGFDIEEKLDPSFSASARFGLEAELNPGIGLVLEAGYRMLRAGGSWSIKDSLDGESVSGEWSGLSLDHFFFGLGLSFDLGR